MAVRKFSSIIRSPKSTHPVEDVQISFYPLEGLDPKGGVFPASKFTSADEDKLDKGTASPDTLKGVPNLADATKEAPSQFATSALVAHVNLVAAYVHCHKCRILPPKPGEDKWRMEGSTSEAALKVAAWKGTKGRLVDKDSADLLATRFPKAADGKERSVSGQGLERQLSPPLVDSSGPGEAVKNYISYTDLEVPFNSDRKMA